MSNTSLGYHELNPNYGFYIDKVPQEILDNLKPQINNLIINNFNNGVKVNHELEGEIEHEFRMVPSLQIKNYIKKLSQEFENKSRYMSSNYPSNKTLKFNDLWVNFQKKHEYNPIHSHIGVYSFVIWYQIPYLVENEKKYSFKTKEKKCFHGSFEFLTPTLLSDNLAPKIKACSLDIDKSKEGYITIFPSSLHHVVYPFYSSDDYRITIAGNIKIS